MRGEILTAASAAYQAGGQPPATLPAWLVGELIAASHGGEPFPLARPNLIAAAVRLSGDRAALAALPLTPRQRRIACALARLNQGRKKILLCA